jgi:hypothetical protein
MMRIIHADDVEDDASHVLVGQMACKNYELGLISHGGVVYVLAKNTSTPLGVAYIQDEEVRSFDVEHSQQDIESLGNRQVRYSGTCSSIEIYVCEEGGILIKAMQPEGSPTTYLAFRA